MKCPRSCMRGPLLPPFPPPLIVWNWKIKQRLAAMKEAGDKAKSKEQGSSSEKKESSASPAAVGPLPGEKVIVLDENLKDGELEAYWAQLRKEREEGGQEKEGTKPKRKTIKVCIFVGSGMRRRRRRRRRRRDWDRVLTCIYPQPPQRHFLFGWNYSNKAKKEAAAVAGAKAPAQPPKKATASAGAGGKQ